MHNNFSIIKEINCIHLFYIYIKESYPLVNDIVYNSNSKYLSIKFDDTDTYNINSMIDYIDDYTNPESFIYGGKRIINSTNIHVNSTDFVPISTILYYGYNTEKRYVKINLLSNLNDNLDEYLLETFNYTVRAIDITNNVVLSVCTFNNKNLQKCVLDIDSELLSSDDSIIQIQGKKNVSGEYLNIEYIDVLW